MRGLRASFSIGRLQDRPCSVVVEDPDASLDGDPAPWTLSKGRSFRSPLLLFTTIFLISPLAAFASNRRIGRRYPAADLLHQ